MPLYHFGCCTAVWHIVLYNSQFIKMEPSLNKSQFSGVFKGFGGLYCKYHAWHLQLSHGHSFYYSTSFASHSSFLTPLLVKCSIYPPKRKPLLQKQGVYLLLFFFYYYYIFSHFSCKWEANPWRVHL